MMRVLVVDDEPNARDGIIAMLRDRHRVDVVGSCGDGRAAVQAIRQLSPDLVLLDVQMPECNGFEVVAEIGAAQMPAVIFVTAHEEHALAAFDAHAVDYLLKPFSARRFDEAIARAEHATGRRTMDDESRLRALIDEALGQRQRTSPQFHVRIGDRTVLIDANDVEWMEGAGYHVRLHVAGKSYLHREPLNDIEARVDPEQFLRIHRSAIVRVSAIREVRRFGLGRHALILASGARVDVSRQRWGAVALAVKRLATVTS